MVQITLNQRARIWMPAGTTVEVTPDEANFLLSTGQASLFEPPRPVTTKKAAPKKPAAKKTTAKKEQK